MNVGRNGVSTKRNIISLYNISFHRNTAFVYSFERNTALALKTKAMETK